MIQGLLGEKLSHSYSKIIHNKFYNITGIKGEYRLFEVEKNQIERFLHKCRKEGIHHLNVTIPYKKEVMKYIDCISDQAKMIDAVNTIMIHEDKIYGYNSDYFGFLQTLEKEKIPIKGKKWVVLGSGGACQSVLAVLENNGAASNKIVSRKKTGEGYISYEQLREAKGIDGLVNTTPVGMYPDVNASAIDEKYVKDYQFVVDLIYNPSETLLLSYAKKYGIKHANGLYMLVAQAIKSQEIWHHQSYGKEIIEKIYKEMVKEL